MTELGSEFLVIGSGLAGLTYALGAADKGTVRVVTKAQVAEANTSYAQGGIAAAIGEADSWELHERDTLVAGAGLCDEAAVRHLVKNAPGAIEWLLSLGARFDRSKTGLALGRDGGHSANRIVHHADKTGWEIERAVIEAVRANRNIEVVEHAFVTNLIIEDGSCRGAKVMIEGKGEVEVRGERTMLATGGCGRMYQHTTNPAVATADGIGLGLRVGAKVADLEFMQFHPTTLYHPQLRSYLLTEAMRGAGATLRNHLGQRFMYDYDERLELAPRDVVARSIEAEMKRLSTWCVYLDLTHLKPEQIREEFPTIVEKLETVGLHPHKDWVPVVPAQHYSCGGVITDLLGRSSVPGLYAAGEVARTGVHGANRLASNSLLEAIVFASAAAKDDGVGWQGTGHGPEINHAIPENDAIRIRRALQKAMTDNVGIVRNDKGLKGAVDTIQGLITEFKAMPEAPYSPYSHETLNLLQGALEVASSALSRRENVGLHYNEDLA
mgnify:CR=1 FL=1